VRRSSGTWDATGTGSNMGRAPEIQIQGPATASVEGCIVSMETSLPSTGNLVAGTGQGSGGERVLSPAVGEGGAGETGGMVMGDSGVRMGSGGEGFEAAAAPLTDFFLAGWDDDWNETSILSTGEFHEAVRRRKRSREPGPAYTLLDGAKGARE
jgi:hypothetical protein